MHNAHVLAYRLHCFYLRYPALYDPRKPLIRYRAHR